MERGESAQRSMEAQQRVLCEAENRAGNTFSSFVDVVVKVNLLDYFVAVVAVKVDDIV